MSRDSYFEMCEMMGAEPIEEEIPVELSDLHEEVQEALLVYNMLEDNWDSMNGIYMGKNFAGISDILEMQEVEDKKTCYLILRMLDSRRRKILNSKSKSTS
jgi:hypothetical protein